MNAKPEASLPVGRLAPSPTGLLHLGHARSFLLAWWSVRARGGRVVLRIEDLDRGRSRPEYVETCLRDLEWLGLDWDEGPLFQSADPEPYAQALETLLEKNAAYPCVCSRREIVSATRAPHRGDGELRYPGTCRDRFGSVREAQARTEREAGVRLRVPPGPVELVDDLVGPFTHDVQAEVGDFLLARRDGEIAYQLAVVVDDARQGVTEVLRGDDLLPSATRQWHVQRALGLPHPSWVHVPLVVDARGRRLAKRWGDLGLATLREAGVDGRRVVAWAAGSAGMGGVGGAEALLEARAWVSEYALAKLEAQPVVLKSEVVEGLRRPEGR